jgi:putative Holliday junction resolvase
VRKGVRFALDYGDVRIGVAKSDVDAVFALPVVTLKNDNNIIKELKNIIDSDTCLEIYIGLPKHLSGEIGTSAQKALKFAQQISLSFPTTSIRMIDERLTTTSASSRLHESGINTRQQKSVIDQAAAIELLEVAMEYEKRTNQLPGQDLKEV